MDTDTWRSELKRARAEKDAFLADDPESPIPQEEQMQFDGLEYYPPDSDLRFELRLTTFGDHDELTVETTKDGTRTYYRWGQFRFSIEGQNYTLSAFRSEPDDERLWVPFKDETNGDTTYGGGRYLDLDEDAKTVGGAWVLDFNEAYNPFCAFSEEYECPLVPPENRLAVRIEAGEKAP
jgi:uncharacterized protein (DUF1684 family)